ncbi:MAG: lipoate--protein ligase family protein [Gemmataceae bacterium]|nr:lipoate--protein ligase family protein [Gemmataceae bacterium]MCS7270237.1 lipoate--protein ligase family protein [Gemmataceae bacterium]MDW8243307.1 lipoate--protein ligase family protein [Thermogemmata sp.]
MITLLDLTSPDPAENLAWDEALLLHAEQSGGPEVLRLWESPEPAVVLGAGGSVDQDVHLGHCQHDRVPVLRRASGGGTVLLGPGCLCFSLVLRYDRHPALSDIRASFSYVLQRIVDALAPTVQLQLQESDLVWQDRKVSGNAQQRKRHFLLHHGTLLYAADVAAYARYLLEPARQPAYRRQRPHGQFVANLPLRAAELRNRLIQAWEAVTGYDPATVLPIVHRLMSDKYACSSWHFRR